MAFFKKNRKYVAKRYRKKPAVKKMAKRRTNFKKRVLKVIQS